MYCHGDTVVFAGRKNCLEEIDEVLEQAPGGHRLVNPEQFPDTSQPFGFPTGEEEVVGFLPHFRKHLFGVQRIQQFLVVGKHCGAIFPDFRQVGPRPVEHRHEVVADQVDSDRPQTLQRIDIPFDIHIPVRGSRLYGIVDIHTFDTEQFEALGFDRMLQVDDSFAWPVHARGKVGECGDDTRHTRYLTDGMQAYAVKRWSKPPQCHFHFESPLVCRIGAFCRLAY